MNTRQDALYATVVEISEDFLGPAGERFMRRQIRTHLQIEPEDLQRKHMRELVDWVSLTFAMLTKDSDHVEEFSNRLLALARRKVPARHE